MLNKQKQIQCAHMGLNRLEKNESYVLFSESQYLIQFLECKLLQPISMSNVNFNTL